MSSISYKFRWIQQIDTKMRHTPGVMLENLLTNCRKTLCDRRPACASRPRGLTDAHPQVLMEFQELEDLF
jgi:hypothetical protein